MPSREPNEYEVLLAGHRRQRLRAWWPGWKLLWGLPFVLLVLVIVAIPSRPPVGAQLLGGLVLLAAVAGPVAWAVVDGRAGGFAGLAGAGVMGGLVTLAVVVNSASWAHDDGLGQAFLLFALFWGVVAEVAWVALVAGVAWFVRRRRSRSR